MDEIFLIHKQKREINMSVLAHTFQVGYRATPRAIRQPGLLRRLFGRFLQWRQRRIEQQIAIHLGLTSGSITDEIERRMTERLIRGGGFRS
ncbi:MAG: hypothetical protein QOG74_611 [Alphaproteobacteria bacterium]|nr:hypothetical protein [Alphaproteobacteria bacterium]